MTKDSRWLLSTHIRHCSSPTHQPAIDTDLRVIASSPERPTPLAPCREAVEEETHDRAVGIAAGAVVEAVEAAGAHRSHLARTTALWRPHRRTVRLGSLLRNRQRCSAGRVCCLSRMSSERARRPGSWRQQAVQAVCHGLAEPTSAPAAWACAPGGLRRAVHPRQQRPRPRPRQGRRWQRRW